MKITNAPWVEQFAVLANDASANTIILHLHSWSVKFLNITACEASKSNLRITSPPLFPIQQDSISSFLWYASCHSNYLALFAVLSTPASLELISERVHPTACNFVVILLFSAREIALSPLTFWVMSIPRCRRDFFLLCTISKFFSEGCNDIVVERIGLSVWNIIHLNAEKSRYSTTLVT